MSNTWTKVIDQKIIQHLSDFHFWNGVDVWIERPHLINRKLLATELIYKSTLEHFSDNLMNENIQVFVKNIVEGNIGVKDIGEEFNEYLENTLLEENNTRTDSNDVKAKTFTVELRKLLPRNSMMFSDVLEAVLRDESKNVVTFWPKGSDVLKSFITPSFPYRIQLCDNRIVLETYRSNLETNPAEQSSEDWLKTAVLPKIIKWCYYSPTSSVLPSLNLISPKSYSMIYSDLKEKYAKKYIEMWPECSDPIKYVYEDIAIAAYLMTLWEKERTDLKLSSKQTFVDLGCGNGLLVDILNSQGHMGIGIDVRRRKIWDLYEDHTTLIEKVIMPSEYHIFPNYDWIIGNHSDELTPWIPVIAARSSYKTRAFVLPCCAYTFNGKFERCTQEETQYQSYLSFIHHLCQSMGFIVQKDKLRIPSTKRICFVCSARNYKEEDESCIDNIRNDFITNYSRKTGPISSTSSYDNSVDQNINEQKSIKEVERKSEDTKWIDDFKPRERIESVKNCSQLDKKFLENTVLMVAKILLEKDNFISLERGSETILWNAGVKVKFSDLIKQIPPSTLKGMKNQCGGFQTFLRNHRSVFQIIDGNVQLNVPLKGVHLNSKPGSKRKRREVKKYCFKEKPCFFFFHHPQGCPLEDVDCNFSHQTNEK